MAQDALLVLADDQVVTTVDAVGYAVSEHSINFGATHDPFNGQQVFAVFTVKTTFTAGAADDSFQLQIKAGTGKAWLGAVLNETLPTLGQTGRFLVGDLVKGTRIILPLSPQTAKVFGGGYTPTGNPVVFAVINMKDNALAAKNFTGGAFDLEIRHENVAGQKYYPQTNSVG